MAGKKSFSPDLVLEKAMNLFWKQGYEGTSIEDIVQWTGLGRGSLYDTFGDKEALYMAALRLYLAKFPAELTPYEEANGSFVETLERYFQRWIDGMLSDPEHRGCFLVNTSIEMAPYDSEISRTAQSALDVIEDEFYRHLIKAQASGELARTYDAHQGAQFLLSTLIGIRVLARAKRGREVLQNVAQAALLTFR